MLVKALADPTRLRIVDAIRTVAPEAVCQCELGGHPLHQPLGLAHDAAVELLNWLAFEDVVRDKEKITSVRADDRPGFILTRTADIYGRCVALIGRGDPPAPSGASTNVSVAVVRQTADHHLLTAGLAYPTFYSLLYVDLGEELAQQTAAARNAQKGVFAGDATNAGVTSTARSRSPPDPSQSAARSAARPAQWPTA